MIRSLYTAATGMSSQQMNMDVIAHNLANSSTTAYKRSRANFQDLMYQTIVPPGAETSNNTKIATGLQVGMGAKTVSVQKIYKQGNFVQTDNPLDMAVEGKGFFKILRGTEEVYTRAGSFQMDKDGYLCDSEGSRMQPEIALPKETSNINIDSGGTLTAIDQAGKVLANQTLTLYDFANVGGLISVGRNYLVPT